MAFNISTDHILWAAHWRASVRPSGLADQECLKLRKFKTFYLDHENCFHLIMTASVEI